VGSGGTKHITPSVTGKAPITDITLQPLPIIITGNGIIIMHVTNVKLKNQNTLYYFILHTHAYTQVYSYIHMLNYIHTHA
jgi:hypothetical protein